MPVTPLDRFRGEVEPIDTRAGHIPGSRNLPFTACLREDGTWQDGDPLRHLLERVLGDDERASWAVMCGSGVTACHLAISGLLAGYSEPRVYIGSWSEWIRDASRPVRLPRILRNRRKLNARSSDRPGAPEGPWKSGQNSLKCI
jgi:thiosulfate/3-mercaptopyruvate sulfurtransferase